MVKNQNKLFAYPVLSYDTDDYVGVNFTLESTKILEKRKRISKLKYLFAVDDLYIRLLIDNKQAKGVLKIYCPTTKYREMIDLEYGENEIILNNENVNNRVELESYIILMEDINNFYSLNFNNDYSNDSFNLEKGSIIAMGKYENLFIEKDIYEFTKVSSIIKVRKASENQKELSIDYSDQNIYVYLPENDFITYSQYAKHCLDVVNSMVIFPALVYVLEALAKDEELLSQYEYNRWFRVINKKVKEIYNMDLTSTFIINADSIIIAQKILEFPLTAGFEWIKMKID